MRMFDKRIDASEVKGKIDFGIITIREDEFEAVLQRFPVESFASGKQTYSLSRLETSTSNEYRIAMVRCPEQGNAMGQSVAHNLIEDLNPQWILLVGIGGSLPSDEHTLGDVVLSSRLHDFNVSARMETGVEYEARGGPMHPSVQDLIGQIPALKQFLELWSSEEKILVKRPTVSFKKDRFYGSQEWIRSVKDSLKVNFDKEFGRTEPTVITGSVVSTDSLIKDSKIAAQWKTTARQLRVIEMELSGIYEAARLTNTPVLAIRGISDIVGYKRSAEWTRYAANAAAAFTLSLLRSHPIKPFSVQTEPTKINESVFKLNPINFYETLPSNTTSLNLNEKLYSNWLKVSYYASQIYTVHTVLKTRAAVWNRLNVEAEDLRDDWVYHGNTLYSFHDFSEDYWRSVIDSDPEPQPITSWANSNETQRTNIFIELLKKSLIELAKARDLRYSHRRPLRYLYFASTDNLQPRIVSTKSLKRTGSHTVFNKYERKGKIVFYRHSAFRFHFVSFNGEWYLEITPTYHYTKDGKTLYPFYEDELTGIKKQENNQAVFRQVLFWEEILKNDPSNYIQQERKYPYLEFGELMSFQFQHGILDEVWRKTETSLKENASNQGVFVFK